MILEKDKVPAAAKAANRAREVEIATGDHARFVSTITTMRRFANISLGETSYSLLFCMTLLLFE